MEDEATALRLEIASYHRLLAETLDAPVVVMCLARLAAARAKLKDLERAQAGLPKLTRS